MSIYGVIIRDEQVNGIVLPRHACDEHPYLILYCIESLSSVHPPLCGLYMCCVMLCVRVCV